MLYLDSLRLTFHVGSFDRRCLGLALSLLSYLKTVIFFIEEW